VGRRLAQPSIKVEAVRVLGAESLLIGDTYDDAYEHARALEASEGLTYVHPYDDPDVIAGQGTVAMEILRQRRGEIDAIFGPVGGGALIAGIAADVKHLVPSIRVIGVEPDDAACLRAALDAGTRVKLAQVGIFADGVAVRQIGEEPFRIARECVDDVITVARNLGWRRRGGRPRWRVLRIIGNLVTRPQSANPTRPTTDLGPHKKGAWRLRSKATESPVMRRSPTLASNSPGGARIPRGGELRPLVVAQRELVFTMLNSCLACAMVRAVRGGRALAFAGWVVATQWTTLLRAEPNALVMEWQVVDGCPDRAAAQSGILAALAARGMTRAPAARLSVTITRRADARYEARVVILDARGSGERRFDGATCAHVAEAAELIASIALEESDVAERSVHDEQISARAPEIARPAEATQLSLGLRAALDVGSLPKPSTGLGISLGLQWGKAYAEFDALVWLPSATHARSGGEIGMFVAGLSGCYPAVVIGSAFDLAPCLGAEAGLTASRGVNLAQSLRPLSHWAAVFAGISARQSVGSGLQTVFWVEAGLPLFRPEYVVYDAGQRVRVFRAGPAVARVGLGIVWLFR
jgi:hypothetical protein